MAVFLVFLFITFAAGSVVQEGKDYKIHHETKPITSNNKVIGMASTVISSRNGRLSSLGSINIFPRQAVTYSGNGVYYPLRVSSEKDGRYASGTVQVYPGFASATARAGYVPNGPLYNDLFMQPDVFSTRSLQPWFAKNLIVNYDPPKPDSFRNTWLFPSFNPFMNFWR